MSDLFALRKSEFKSVHTLLRISNGIDALNEKVGNVVGWLTTLLVIVVCYNVFTRYVLNTSNIASQELEWHIFAIIFLFGAGYTLRHNRHVRVDVFYHNFSPKQKAWVDLIGSLIFLIPFAILVIVTSWNFTIGSYQIGETSPDPGGLPARYILKACLPLGAILLLLQGISLALKSLVEIKKNN